MKLNQRREDGLLDAANRLERSATKTGRLTLSALADAPFGLEIRGLEPENITEDDKAYIWEAHRVAHGLLCFSFERLLEAHELHALTSVFGKSEYAPGIINGLGKQPTPSEKHLTVEQQLAIVRARGEDPFMTYIGNLDPTTLRKQSLYEEFYSEWEWHTDMSYIETPPTFSLLHARQVPHEGGDTGFCNQVMAAQELTDVTRNRVSKLKIKHDSTYNSDGSLRPGMVAPESPIEALGYPHPVIRTMPNTDIEALYLGRRTNGYILGMTLEESEQLLNELWAHATQVQFCYRHKWQPGQVVVWDNRLLMHKRFPMDDQTVRFMWRTQTKGEAVQPVTSSS